MKTITITATTQCSETSCYLNKTPCGFLASMRFGTIPICNLYNKELYLGDREDGYPIMRCEECLTENN